MGESLDGGYHVAPGPKPNTLKPIAVGFCLLEIAKPKLPPKPDESKSGTESKKNPVREDWLTKPDEYLGGLEIKPLADAFVAIIPRPESSSTTIYGKTTGRGALLRLDKNALDQTPPNDGEHTVSLPEGVTYGCFWCFDLPLFKEAIKQIGAASSSAIRKCGFFEFTFKMTHLDKGVLQDFFPSQPDESRVGWPQTREAQRLKLAMLFHNLGPKGDGYFTHSAIAEANRKGENDSLVDASHFKGPMNRCWVFARRPAITTTYLAEFVIQYGARAMENSAWHYETMASVLALVDVGKKLRRIEGLDGPLFGAPASDEHPDGYTGIPAAEEYWRYAARCGSAYSAEKGFIQRETFAKTLYNFMTYGRPPNAIWYQAADKIKSDFGIPHPSRGDPNETLKLVPPQAAKSLLAYFDFYQFARQQDDPNSPRYHNGWMAYVPATRAKIEEAIEGMMEEVRRHFRENGNCVRLWADVGWHVKQINGDSPEEPRREMNLRFLDAAEDVAYDWWEGFPDRSTSDKAGVGGTQHDNENKDPSGENQEAEPEIPDELKEVRPVILAGWISAAKQSELFERFFAWRSRTMLARVTRLEQELGRMLRKVRHVDAWLVRKGGMVAVKEEDVALELQLSVGERTGKILVKKEGELVGEFRVRVIDRRGGQQKIETVAKGARAGGDISEHGGPDWGHSPKGFKQLEDPKGSMKVPQWFAAAGYAILIAFKVQELLEKRNDKKNKDHDLDGSVVAEIGVDLGFEISTIGEALELTFLELAKSKGWRKVVHVIEGWGKFGKLAMSGAIAIEAILVAREGLIALEEARVTSDMGQPIRAALLETKGCVYLGGFATSVVAAVYFGFATGGLVLAVVGIGGAVIEVLSWFGEEETAMKETEEALIRAIGEEFGKDFAPHVGTKKYKLCRTYDALVQLGPDLEKLAQALNAMDRLSDERARRSGGSGGQ